MPTFAASIAVVHIARWTVATCSAANRVGACSFAVASAIVAQALVHVYTIDMCTCPHQHIKPIDQLTLTFAACIAVVHIPRWTVAACSAAHRVGTFPFAVAPAVVVLALVRADPAAFAAPAGRTDAGRTDEPARDAVAADHPRRSRGVAATCSR